MWQRPAKLLGDLSFLMLSQSLAYSPVNQNLVCFTTYQSVSKDVAEIGKVVRRSKVFKM